MALVVCWCCDYYVPITDDSSTGLCKKTLDEKLANDTVCDRFLIRRGLYTKREIPDYFKNYNKK